MDSIQIRFNPDLFNNIYWHLEEAFRDTSIRYIWAYGGSSASKTYSVVQLVIKEMLNAPDENTLILRKFHVDIKDSIYADFKNIISAWNLSDYFIIQQDYIKCVTGSYVRFRGLDDSEKVKGITGFKRVILEEVSQFEEVDFKQIRKRLRGRIGQQIIGLFNPIVEEHWIKANVFDKTELKEVDTNIYHSTASGNIPICGKWVSSTGNTVILKTNYLDNKYIVGPHFIDQHVIDDFEKDKKDDFSYYEVYGLGNWGKLRTGGEFWKDFNRNIHIKPVKWNESLPIHITWDKNVNPYLTCLPWQVNTTGSDKVITQIDELCLEDPSNRVRHVCAEFKKRYPIARVNGLFIYGDRTAMAEDTLKEKGENFYTDILKELADYHPKLRMQSVNPSVVISGAFVNEAYAGRIKGISIVVGASCKKSIYDYSYALEDMEGGIDKKKKAHPVTKVPFEEFGHCSDAKRYLFTMLLASEYDTYRRGNKAQYISQGKAVAKHGY